MATKFSTSIYPKVISGKETMTVTTSSSSVNIELTGKAKAFNVFFTIDNEKKLLPLYVFEPASDPTEWVNTAHKIDFQAVLFYPSSLDFNANLISNLTLQISASHQDTVDHTINIYYFIYEERSKS